MKKIALCIAALAALVGPRALAADMAVKSPPTPPAAPVFSWTGFYIGGFAGGARASSAETSDPCFMTTTCAVGATFDGLAPINYGLKTGFSGGGTVGYNWQVSPYVVVGLENKLGYFHVHASASLNDPGFPQISAFTTYGDWYDAYMARIGAVVGRAMLFFEGGGATARIQTGYIDTVTPVTLSITSDKTETSWAFGGGLQYALDDHWSLEGEVLALGLRGTIAGCGIASNATGPWCNQTKIGNVAVVDFGVDYAFK